MIQCSAGIWMVFQGNCPYKQGSSISPRPSWPRDAPQPPPLTLFTSLKTQAAEGFTSRKPRPQKSLTNSKDDVIYSRACYFSSGILKHIFWQPRSAHRTHQQGGVCVCVSVSVYLFLWTRVSCLNRWFNHIFFPFRTLRRCRSGQIRSISSPADIKH